MLQWIMQGNRQSCGSNGKGLYLQTYKGGKQILDRYADRIVGILRDKGITGVYNNREKLVYAIVESPHGDIFSTYGNSSGLICNYAVYALYIPGYLLGKVADHISSVNNTIVPGGFFYIDHSTQCIAFTTLYKVYDLEIRQDLPSFISFCTRSIDLFQQYREVFHELINNTE